MERRDDSLEERRGGVDEVHVSLREEKADWRVGEVEWMKSRCSGVDGRQAGE